MLSSLLSILLLLEYPILTKIGFTFVDKELSILSISKPSNKSLEYLIELDVFSLRFNINSPKLWLLGLLSIILLYISLLDISFIKDGKALGKLAALRKDLKSLNTRVA